MHSDVFFFSAENLQDLRIGLEYPDFPCGKFSIAENDRVIFQKKLCSVFKLMKNLVGKGNRFSSSYSSHKGYYSIWHSMTYNPERSVGKITNDIIEQILALLDLAFMDDTHPVLPPQSSFFWLGMALHVVMDSYSPAHVLRASCLGYDAVKIDRLVNDVLPNMQVPVAQETQNSNRLLRDLKDALKPIASDIESDKDIQEIQDLLETMYTQHGIQDSNTKRRVQQLAFFLYFFNHQQLKIKRLLNTSIGKIKAQDIGKDANPIITYYFYPSQPGMFHKKHDLIVYVKKMGMMENVIRDCYKILAIFMKYKDQPKKRGAFLRESYEYLRKTVFVLYKGTEGLRTGMDHKAVPI